VWSSHRGWAGVRSHDHEADQPYNAGGNCAVNRAIDDDIS
jgi:hypothetical protein